MGACGSSEAGQPPRGGGSGSGAAGGGAHHDVGRLPSMSEASPEEVRVSKSIDKMLREEEKRLSREVKMLLLGPGSAGKSTILKQMKVIHLKGFTKSELEDYRQQIYRNVVEGVRTVVGVALDELDSQAGYAGGADDIEELEAFHTHLLRTPPEINSGQAYPSSELTPILNAWNDPRVQRVVLRGREEEVGENLTYYLNSANIQRLFAPNYVPTDIDVLRCRQKTTGITETNFKSSDLTYRLFDVGGQRSERKKWIHCFENVTAVLFLAAVSGYDQSLLEDKDSNQMQEALMLFDSICNSQWFLNTSIILFLNKVDVFKERILVSSIKNYFPDYEGDDTDYNAAREYFKMRFTRLNRSQSKEIYTNYTTAIDTNLIRVVMASVYDIIVTRNLNDIIL
ncbi:G protein alpha subunit [Pseudohyphozyma bogoriensis]|nr:G protein alpha subunit [Pseudohyphozyma bogoriensis]